MNGKFHPTQSQRIRNCLPILGKIETLLKQSIVWHIFLSTVMEKRKFWHLAKTWENYVQKIVGFVYFINLCVPIIIFCGY